MKKSRRRAFSLEVGASCGKLRVMKVLQVLTHLDIGGIPSYVYSLSKYLLRAGLEVGVASSGGSQEELFRQLGVKIFRLNIKTKSELSPKLVGSFWQLAKIRKQFPFEIIHSHTRVTQVLAQLFSRVFGLKHIANFHGFYRQNKLRWGRKIIKAQGAASIAITPQVGADLVELFGANKDRVNVIITPIDLERLSQPAPPLDLAGSPKIGSSGRLSNVKGFGYLIAALPQILKSYPQACLYILGQGKDEQNLLKAIKKLGLEAHFKIVKGVEPASFLKGLDIFCLPSLEEPLGLAVLEAQYFGLPCIVSAVDGLKILVDHSTTGLLVPPTSPPAIAQAVDQLMRDQELKTKIAQNSRQQVRTKFDLSKRIEEFTAIYKKVLNENPGIRT